MYLPGPPDDGVLQSRFAEANLEVEGHWLSSGGDQGQQAAIKNAAIPTRSGGPREAHSKREGKQTDVDQLR